jgi:hypothetical protein
MALAIAEKRFIRPAAHDFWVDEHVDAYNAKMRLARRLTYLAVRAVEYEFQESLTDRQAVLSAEIPAELQQVVDNLRAVTGTRAIRGNRPTDLKIVLSLRKQILQLSDLKDQGPEWLRLTDVERLQALLGDPTGRFAVYDESGRYLGQRIPFNLAPLGRLNLGVAQGVPIFTGGDCAERLWNVNASIVGQENEPLYVGEMPSFMRIDLLKSNTFFSQWCDPARTDLQSVSVRPTRNLFRDPENVDSPATTLGAVSEATLESRARLEAYFNVSREELESDEYASGSTSELAARGLYGSYALFIPAELISRMGSTGLNLDAVDDILIRLDYVSVAR